MTRHYGSQSMVAPLRTVLVKRPDAAFAVEDPLAWHYSNRPDLAIAQQEHDALVNLLHQDGAEVLYHDEPQPNHADAIYTFYPAIVTDHRPIILSMGNPHHRRHDATMPRPLQQLAIPR